MTFHPPVTPSLVVAFSLLKHGRSKVKCVYPWGWGRAAGGSKGHAPYQFSEQIKSAFSSDAQSRFTSFVLDRDCPRHSVVPRAMHEARLRAPEGRCVNSNGPSRVQEKGKGVAGRNGREKCFPNEG